MQDAISSDEIWFLAALWSSRSLKVAAKKRAVSLSSATRMMSALRERFQDPLFVRGSGGLVPTPVMTALWPRIEAAQRTLLDVSRSAVFDPKTIHAAVRIGCVDNAVITFLSPSLPTLFAQAPNLSLTLEPLPEDPVKALESGALDLLFYAPPIKALEAGLRSAALHQTRHVLVVRKGYPILEGVARCRAAGRDATPELLEPYREIEITYGPLSRRRSGETSASRAGRDDSRIAVRSDFFLAAAMMLLETDFYVRLPVPTFERLVKYLPICALPASLRQLPKWQGKLIWHERTDLDPTLIWVRSILTSGLREH